MTAEPKHGKYTLLEMDDASDEDEVDTPQAKVSGVGEFWGRVLSNDFVRVMRNVSLNEPVTDSGKTVSDT